MSVSQIMDIDCVKNKKGEWLIIISEDDGVYICCFPDGRIGPLNDEQLDLNSRKYVPEDSKLLTQKQKDSSEEEHIQKS